jgi:hypothetical protein
MNWDTIIIPLVRPFFALLFFAVLVIPVRLAIDRLWPNNKLPRLKQFLFKRR